MNRPTLTELQSSAQEFIQNRTGLTQFSEGSVGGCLTSMHASAINQLYDILDQAVQARDIETSSGTDLDALARPYGIVRRSGTVAGSNSSTGQVVFVNTTGSSVTINQSTAVWSTTNPGTKFYTTSGITITAGNSGTVQVQSNNVGTSYNIAPGQINASNTSAGVTATNFLPITGGSNSETDDAFRYRISQAFQIAITGGSSSILGVLSYMSGLPGVGGIVINSEARGPGTCDALIVPGDGSVPDDSFLTSMQEQMASVVAAGVSVMVSGPTYIPVSTQVIINTTGTSTNIDSARSQVSSLVSNYINSLPVSFTVGPNTVSSFTSSSSANIDYASLLAAATSVVSSLLGSAFSSIELIFTINNYAISGPVTARNGESFVSSSTDVRIVQS